MKITQDEFGEIEIVPENKNDEEELETLRETCANSGVLYLQWMLYNTSVLWRSLILAEQIYEDLIDYACLEVIDES